MQGWIVVNGFLMTHKFSELTVFFMKAAKEQKIRLSVVKNSDCFMGMFENKNLEKPDFVLFWDKDLLLAKYLESEKIPVFNSSTGIEICDDKRMTALRLNQEKIAQPLTIPAPMTYGNIGFSHLDFLQQIEKNISFPMVVKEAYGSFGQQVYLVKNHEELVKRTKKLEKVPFLYQQYIAGSKGRDLRLQVVGDQVVAAMERSSDHDFRANLSNGGKMKAYQPEKEAVDLAIQACKAVECDFAGVDLLFGSRGYLVCEVNSNAHFKNLWECTGIDTAWHILQYIRKKVEET